MTYFCIRGQINRGRIKVMCAGRYLGHSRNCLPAFLTDHFQTIGELWQPVRKPYKHDQIMPSSTSPDQNHHLGKSHLPHGGFAEILVLITNENYFIAISRQSHPVAQSIRFAVISCLVILRGIRDPKCGLIWGSASENGVAKARMERL
jgi:hypothetical protein